MVLWLRSWEMEAMAHVQILNETFCILHNANTLGKSMYPIILSPYMSN